MTRKLSVLGSTGSIGTQTLDVAEKLGISIAALAAHSNASLLEQQARKFRPRLVVLYDKQAAKKLKISLADTDIKVLCGMEGLCEAAAAPQADTVLNAVVGMVGLAPTLAAAQAKKNIALANKETLVAGGSLVMQAVKENHINLYPVDSEHSAIFQCLQGCPDEKALSRIILTASGGPFFGKTREELQKVTPKEALKHPNWSMGAKITIDSATMMNKGLEIIEASWLFGLPEDKIDVVVHRESIVHSLIEYQDNSVIAQMGVPDMRIPIQYALTYPERVPSPVQKLNLAQAGRLTFYEPDTGTFSCMEVCRKAIRIGGLAPAAVNGANEEAVALFLKEKISFLDIGRLTDAAMNNQPGVEITCIQDIIEADKSAREFVLRHAT